VTFSVWSCKKDNYDAPSSTLSGKLVYQGAAVELEYDRVPFRFYQYGFGKTGSIDGTFAPDGSYSAVLFDGSYKMVIPIGQGPFKSKEIAAGVPDSIDINLNGSRVLDIEVEPYFMIRNPQITIANGTVTGNFKAEKIITDASGRNIERVSLYLNKTKFVSGADNIAATNMNGADIMNADAISMNVAVPAISPVQNYVFARIGLKVQGIEDMIFSSVIKLEY
jgi:hypothetical protein